MLNKKNIPNILTGLRGILTIIIIVLFLLDYSQYGITIWTLFIIASFTDFLDGYLARKWQVVSNFGKIADPLLDKVLVFALLILVFEFSIIPKAFIMILILRDMLIDALRSYFVTKGVTVAAIYTAKLKTAFQMLMINFILLTLIFPTNIILEKAAIITGLTAVIMSLWSAGSYVRIFMSTHKSK